MKKCLLIFTIIIYTFISFEIKVDAGVCDGQVVNVSYDGGYCKSTPITFSAVKNSSDTNLKVGTGRYSVVGFNATGSIYNGKTGVAFCIDPALKSPINSYENVRELNLSTYYDKKVYMMYQKFINDLQYSESNSNMLRATMEAALRVWTIKNGYAYVAEEATLKQDASNFVFCTKENIDKNVDEKLGESKPSLTPNISKDECFGEITSLINDYYNRNTYIWENPIKEDNITTEVIEPNSTNSEYIFKFSISGMNKFFGAKKAVNVLSLDAANFKASIYMGDTDCGTSSCEATIINNITGGASVNLNDTSSSDLIFTVTMSKEQYVQNIQAGKNIISLKYEYNHPMNVDNAYFSRNNASVSDYQRMFGIVNYIHQDSVDIKLAKTANFCEHIGINSYIDADGNSISVLADYISSCQCRKVNVSKLSLAEQEVYNNYCIKDSSNITGELKACTVDSPNTETYNIVLDEEKQLNLYCKIDCKESLDFSNYSGKYKNIKSGTYLSLQFPNTVAQKSCALDMDYASWESDYSVKLALAVNAYNEYKKAESYQITPFEDYTTCISRCRTYNSETKSWSSCGCNKYDTDYTVSYSYTVLVQNGINLYYGSIKSDSWEEETDPSSWITNQKNSTLNALQTKVSNLSPLFEDLNQCGMYLASYNLGNYEETIKLEYEQEVYQSSGLKVNEYKYDYEPTISVEKNAPLTSMKTYSEISTSGYSPRSFTIYNNISEKSSSKYTFGKKYSISYNGGLYDYESYKENALIIDNKTVDKSDNIIDINVASTKKDNDYYFVYTSLGYDNKIYNELGEPGLTRSCTYSTINDLLCVPNTGDPDCLTGDGVSSKILFKIVDSDNIDPNNRLSKSDEGFQNWKDKLAVKDAIENDDTFNPNNLEYSFVLDSAAIKSVRKYNDTSSYSEYIGYLCNSEGNYCMSSFIDAIATGGYINGYRFTDTFATIVNGRKEWKNYDISSGTILEKDVSTGHY